MKTVLFTGAGASRAVGYPLTRELLPRIRRELKDGVLFDGLSSPKKNKSDRRELRSLLKRLLPGYENMGEEYLPLVTDVFSLVEYALVSGESLPVGSDDTLRRFRDLLKQAIADIFVGEFLLDWDDTKPEQVRERRAQRELIQWIERQRGALSLVTTNYDISIEHDLYHRMGRDIEKLLDLGFDWRDVDRGVVRTRPTVPAFRVYKLHGSLDILRCTSCGYVYFNPRGPIVHQPYRQKLDDGNTCHCRFDARLALHIVSPSLVREIRDASLLNVWQSAVECMRMADRWIIVGYSLPPEDLAVRSLLLRAYASARKKPRVFVVQQGDDARSRYELLFPDCIYMKDGLEGSLVKIDHLSRRSKRQLNSKRTSKVRTPSKKVDPHMR